MRRQRFLSLIGVLALSSGSHARAQDTAAPPSAPTRAGDEALYRESLEVARKLTRWQSWRSAQAAWLDLLRAHAGADFVRPDLEEIRLQLRRTSFWSKTKAPDLDALLSGELQGYEPARAWLRIRYTPDTLQDFEASTIDGKPIFTHPAHFQGPWSIELEGTPAEVSAPLLLIARGTVGHGLRFGVRETGGSGYFAHTLFAFDGPNQETLQSVEPKRPKAASDILTAQVRIEAGLLQGIYAGARVLECDRNDPDFGGLSLLAERPFGSLTLEGKVDSGWIDGVLDRAVADKRRAFEAQWQDPSEFALWPGAPTDPLEEVSLEQLLDGLEFLIEFDADQQKLLDAFNNSLQAGRAEAQRALVELQAVPAGALPAELIAYFEFKAAMSLQRHGDALQALGLLPSAPEVELHRALLRAILLGRARRGEQSARELEALALAYPRVAVVHVMLVQTLLRLGNPAAAREAIQRARAAMPGSPSLIELEVKVAKADLGPAWKQVFEHKGARFTVRSDVSAKLCRDAVRVLDKAMERCLFEFGPLPGGRPARSVAFLFAGQSGYRDYVQGIADTSAENTRGLYSTPLKQIIAWNQPDVEQLWDTLRHECVHRYLDLRFGESPRWFGEGLAETFAASAQRDESWKPGSTRATWMKLLLEKRLQLPALENFAHMDEAGFLEDSELNYALSWAWMHFLRFENDAGRKLFAAILAALDEGLDNATALDRALANSDGAALQSALVRFVNRLAR